MYYPGNALYCYSRLAQSVPCGTHNANPITATHKMFLSEHTKAVCVLLNPATILALCFVLPLFVFA